MELIYLSVLLIAIAFAFVVIYLCIILKKVSNTMKSLGSTAVHVEEQLKMVTPQLTGTVQETDKLIDDVEEKVKATDSVFDAMEDFGTSLTSANEAYQHRFHKLTDEEMDQQVKPFIEGIKWSEVATRLYSTYQSSNTSDYKNVEITGKEG